MATPNSPLPALDVHQRYTVEESLRYLRTSRATLYKQISDGTIKTLTQGRRRYLPGSELARMSSVPSAEAAA
jgi:excisionase family DNA binding protein